MSACLESWMGHTVAGDGSEERGQGLIDGGVDGATEAVGQENVGDAGHDTHV